jgi:predicted TPR repeat methyltransferase
MKKQDYKALAKQYDEQAKEYDSYGHDVLFGMIYEYVKPNEKILDLGIGTGLASIKLAIMGLKVYGLDISDEMLNICKIKSFTEDLKLHNLLDDRIPYSDAFFNHIISCGVFHFFGDLRNIFTEVARIIKRGGIFAFTISPENIEAEYKDQMTSWGVPIFKHSPIYIKRLLEQEEMSLLKEQRLLLKGADKVNYDMLFSVMIAKCK